MSERIEIDLDWIERGANAASIAKYMAIDPAVVAELIRRLREAEKDAGRYRHMRASATFQNRNGPGVYWYLPRWDRQLEIGERLDRAIDSAMGEPK